MKQNRENCSKQLKRIAKALSIGIFLAVSGCAISPEIHPPYDQPLPFHERSLELAEIKSWVIDGSILIKTPKKAESASVDWQQVDDTYTIELYGPLGIGGASIKGGKGTVTMVQGNGTVLTAATPEILVKKALDWDLPISNLYYWIRGIPAPLPYTNLELDQYQHLVSMEQQGWSIQYLQYSGVENEDLPTLLILKRDNLIVKIVVTQWDI